MEENQLKYERFKFEDLFDIIENENKEVVLRPKHDFIVGSTEIKSGTELLEGILEAGIDFHLYKNKDLAFEIDSKGEYIIPYKLIGFYTESN